MEMNEEGKVLLLMVLNRFQPTIGAAIHNGKAMMEKKGIAVNHSDRTYRRFLEKWRKENLSLWVFYRQGEATLAKKVLPSLARGEFLEGQKDLVLPLPS